MDHIIFQVDNRSTPKPCHLKILFLRICLHTRWLNSFSSYRLGACGPVRQRHKHTYSHLCEPHECGSWGPGQISHRLCVAGEKRDTQLQLKLDLKFRYWRNEKIKKCGCSLNSIFILSQLASSFMRFSLFSFATKSKIIPGVSLPVVGPNVVFSSIKVYCIRLHKAYYPCILSLILLTPISPPPYH